MNAIQRKHDRLNRPCRSSHRQPRQVIAAGAGRDCSSTSIRFRWRRRHRSTSVRHLACRHFYEPIHGPRTGHQGSRIGVSGSGNCSERTLRRSANTLSIPADDPHKQPNHQQVCDERQWHREDHQEKSFPRRHRGKLPIHIHTTSWCGDDHNEPEDDPPSNQLKVFWKPRRGKQLKHTEQEHDEHRWRDKRHADDPSTHVPRHGWHEFRNYRPALRTLGRRIRRQPAQVVAAYAHGWRGRRHFWLARRRKHGWGSLSQSSRATGPKPVPLKREARCAAWKAAPRGSDVDQAGWKPAPQREVVCRAAWKAAHGRTGPMPLCERTPRRGEVPEPSHDASARRADLPSA